MKITQSTITQIRPGSCPALPRRRQAVGDRHFHAPAVLRQVGEPSGPTSRIPDVTDSLTIKIDASADATLAALHRLDVDGPARRALLALGANDRAVLPPTPVAVRGADVTLGAIWRLEGGSPAGCLLPGDFEGFETVGHVKTAWVFRVRPAAAGGSYLSVSRRFEATDEVSRARLLDAWGLVGAVGDTIARRAAAAVKADAEREPGETLAA
jgi:hypothetical protein